MYCAFALLAVGLMAQAGRGGAALDAAGWLFLAGSLVFSGSLYVLCITGEKMARHDHPDRRRRHARRLDRAGHRGGGSREGARRKRSPLKTPVEMSITRSAVA